MAKTPDFQPVWQLTPNGARTTKTWTVQQADGTDAPGSTVHTVRLRALQQAAELAAALDPPHRISIVVDTGITGSNGETYLILDPR